MAWAKFTKPMQPTLTDDFRPVAPVVKQAAKPHRGYRAVKDRHQGALVAVPFTRHQMDPWGQQAKMAEVRRLMAQGLSRVDAERKIWG